MFFFCKLRILKDDTTSNLFGWLTIYNNFSVVTILKAFKKSIILPICFD